MLALRYTGAMLPRAWLFAVALVSPALAFEQTVRVGDIEVAAIRPALIPVVRAVDGDTIIVGAGAETETVRLYGRNTPERHSRCPTEDQRVRERALATTAYLRTAALVAPGVALERPQGVPRRDDFGRLLRRVWLSDGRELGDVLEAEGLAVTVGGKNTLRTFCGR